MRRSSAADQWTFRGGWLAGLVQGMDAVSKFKPVLIDGQVRRCYDNEFAEKRARAFYRAEAKSKVVSVFP